MSLEYSPVSAEFVKPLTGLEKAAKNAEEVLGSVDAERAVQVLYATRRVGAVYNIHPQRLGLDHVGDIIHDLNSFKEQNFSDEEIRNTLTALQTAASCFYGEATISAVKAHEMYRVYDQGEMIAKSHEEIDLALWKYWRPMGANSGEIIKSFNNAMDVRVRVMSKIIYRNHIHEDGKIIRISTFDNEDQESHDIEDVGSVDRMHEDVETNLIFRKILNNYSKKTSTLAIALMRGFQRQELVKMGIDESDIDAAKTALIDIAADYPLQYELMKASRPMTRNDTRTFVDIRRKLGLATQNYSLDRIFSAAAKLEPREKLTILWVWNYCYEYINAKDFNEMFGLDRTTTLRDLDVVADKLNQLLQGVHEPVSIKAMVEEVNNYSTVTIGGRVARVDSKRVKLLDTAWASDQSLSNLLTQNERKILNLAIEQGDTGITYTNTEIAERLGLPLSKVQDTLDRLLKHRPETRLRRIDTNSGEIVTLSDGRVPHEDSPRVRIYRLRNQVTDEVLSHFTERQKEVLRLVLTVQDNQFMYSDEQIAQQIEANENIVYKNISKIVKKLEKHCLAA
jgi:DNA-binding CsgD family transcriptional regulator